MAIWVLDAIWTGGIAYLFPFLALRDRSSSLLDDDGHVVDMWMLGVLIASIIIMTVNLRMALETRYWTWIIHLAIWGQVAIYWVFLLVYSLIIWWRPFEIGYIYFMICIFCTYTFFFFFVRSALCGCLTHRRRLARHTHLLLCVFARHCHRITARLFGKVVRSASAFSLSYMQTGGLLTTLYQYPMAIFYFFMATLARIFKVDKGAFKTRKKSNGNDPYIAR
jgi:hypothetical protein